MGVSNRLVLILMLVASFAYIDTTKAETSYDQQTRFTVSNISNVFLYSGDTEQIEFYIKNNMENKAYAVFLDVIPVDGSAVKVVGTTKRYFAEVNPGEELKLNYMFFAEKDVKEGSYNVLFNIKWATRKQVADEYVETIEFSEPIYVSFKVSNGKAEIALEKIYTDPPDIRPGLNITLNLLLRNVGNSEARLIKATMKDPVFSPLNSDNRFFVDSVPPNATALVSYDLQVPKWAGTGQYIFNLQMDYEDGAHTNNIENSTFSIILNGDPPISIREIEMEPLRLTPDSVGIMKITLINSGNERINDVKVRIQGGSELLTESYQFIGTLYPNVPVGTTFGISIPSNVEFGDYGLSIELFYSDPTGNEFVKKNIYVMRIYPKKPYIPEMYMPYIYTFLGLIGLGGLVYIFLLFKSGFIYTKKFG